MGNSIQSKLLFELLFSANHTVIQTLCMGITLVLFALWGWVCRGCDVGSECHLLSHKRALNRKDKHNQIYSENLRFPDFVFGPPEKRANIKLISFLCCDSVE